MLKFELKTPEMLIICAFLGILFQTTKASNISKSSKGCGIYSEADFLGEPILNLKSLDTVYDISLISVNSSGILKSVQISPNCGLLICASTKLEGDCSEHFASSKNVSQPYEFKSAMCQCSSNSESTVANKDTNRGCATLHKDWNFSGKVQEVLFAGSAGRVNLNSDLKSVRIRPNCSITLWKHLPTENKQVSLTLESSTTYLKRPTDGQYEWFCCQCDQASEGVCKNAKESELSTSMTLEKNPTDFSQFVKYGKKIIGIGRNYRWKKSELAKVLKEPTEPIVFMKPSTSYIVEGQKIELLQSLGTIFYEIELGVVIGKRGRTINKSNALDYVAGYFLALDMTAKGFLKKSVNQSLPWEIGKGFDTACPVGHFIPKHLIPDPNNIDLLCKVNGNVTQSDNTSGMIFDVQHLISYISTFMTLEPYDVILTGTPDGLGPLSPGDLIEGQLGNITTIKFEAVGINDIKK